MLVFTITKKFNNDAVMSIGGYLLSDIKKIWVNKRWEKSMASEAGLGFGKKSN